MGPSDYRHPPVKGCRAYGDPGAADRGEGFPSTCLGEAKITNHYRPGKGVDGNPAYAELSAGRCLHSTHYLAIDDTGEHERDETRQKKHDSNCNERCFLPSHQRLSHHHGIDVSTSNSSRSQVSCALFI